MSQGVKSVLTPEQDAWLLANYDRLSVAECMRHLGFNHHQVFRKHVFRLGLGSSERAAPRWPPDMVAFMRMAWQLGMPGDEIADWLGRSLSSVLKKINDSGIHRARSPVDGTLAKVGPLRNQQAVAMARARHARGRPTRGQRKRAECPPAYGGQVGNARVYLIDQRPQRLERRELKPSARVFVSGSTMAGMTG